MSNPTSNFGWVMPTSTDLVTDLPADFAVFGQGVDTTMADLLGGTTGQVLSKTTNANMDFTWVAANPGDITAVNTTAPLAGGATSGAVTLSVTTATTSATGVVQLSDSTSTTSSVLAATPTAVKTSYDLAAAAIPKSTVTTNGDLIYGTGSGTVSRIGIGSTSQVLTVSGGVPTWASPSSSVQAFTLLNTGGTALTGAQTVRVTGITSNTLQILIKGASAVNSGTRICIRFNNDNGTQTVYRWYGMYGTGTTVDADFADTGSFFGMGKMGTSATDTVQAGMMVYGCKASTPKPVIGMGSGSGTSRQQAWFHGAYENSAAITSVDIYSDNGNLDAGTVYVYGSAV
jgi:hypothetical protein